jgi:acetyl esterase/lipase
VLNRPFDHLTGIIGDENSRRKRICLFLHLAGQFLPYAKDDVLHHPYVSPIYTKRRVDDEVVIPPILLQVGKCELFRDEAIAFYTRVFPGVRIRLEVFEDMCHVWQLLGPVEMFGRYSFHKVGVFVDGIIAGNVVERNAVEYRKGGSEMGDVEEHVLEDLEEWIEEGRRDLERLFGDGLGGLLPKVPEGEEIGMYAL